LNTEATVKRIISGEMTVVADTFVGMSTGRKVHEFVPAHFLFFVFFFLLLFFLFCSLQFLLCLFEIRMFSTVRFVGGKGRIREVVALLVTEAGRLLNIFSRLDLSLNILVSFISSLL